MDQRTSTLVAPRGVWWRKLGRDEMLWLAIIVVWAVGMFVMMLFIWPRIGDQQNDMESYRIDTADFRNLTNDFIAKYQTGEVAGVPVVSPPPGSDVYIEGSRFMWRPIVELERGETYRFLISSVDVQHGFSLLPDNVNFQILPGFVAALDMTPHESGQFTVVCNEYCGLGHHTMTGRINVVEPGTAATPAPRAEAAATPATPSVEADVTIDMVDIEFEPDSFTIPADTPVTVALPNVGLAPHNFTIDALGISVDAASGETAYVEINAPAGEYEFHCNVPGHKEAGMTGTLTVEAGGG
jgi:cytochrome c oxidase subunit 2